MTDGTNSAAYRYLTNSGIVSEITFTNAGARRMITTRQFDGLNRLTNTVSSNATAVVVSAHGYQYNSANQRTRTSREDGSYWVYQYDSLGQVTSGKKYWADGTPVAGQQFEYGFDDIGNRNSTKVGGDSTGANLRSASYTANTLNQITQRGVPGYVNIVGAASATATNVNVNNTLAYRRGEYYRVELSTNNGSAAMWLGVTNRVVQNGTTNSVTGNLFLPKTPEVFAHDADGNLTNDGHWAYVWDAENRLTRLVAPSAIPTGARYALNFTNDWRGRRTSKVVSNWTGSAWSKSYEHKFVYDGWNLVATLDSANTLLYSFQWGTDLSGTMQGAGGVGGLVSMTVHSGASTGTYFYAFDGNGNVAALINAADGTIAARYEYGPFGELIRATGPLAFLNPFRFSTKFQDDETGFLYYGYRYYDPSAGRWLNRDPINERGGANLYGFVDNNSANRIDALGLQVLPVPVPPGPPIVVLPPPGVPPNIIPFPTPPPVVRPIGLPQVAACIAVAVGGWYLGDWIGEETGIHDGLGDVIGGIIAPPEIVGGATGTHPGSPFPAGSRDPLTLPRVNPGPCGKCGNGCKPCPPNSPAWEVNEPGHGSSTTHWHWIEYHQRPPTHPKFPCECVPIRQSSPTKPSGA